MIKMNSKFISTLVLASLTVSCSQYLDTMPDDRTIIDSPEKVGELLVTAYPEGSYITFCEAMSDNAGDKSRLAPIQDQMNEESYFWKDISATFQDSPDFYWSSCYKAIATCNHALEVMDQHKENEKYDAYRGEALLARAYNHFMLVTLFSQRYDPATAARELGIPYVTEPEKVVYGKYERKTVEYVYEMIGKDIEAALPLITDESYTAPEYHFTKAAAYGFASRFYLYKGDWEKAYECAKISLGKNYTNRLRDWKHYSGLDYYDIRRLYTKNTESANLLLAGAVSVLGRYNGGYRYGMTIEIRDRIFTAANVTGGMLMYKIFGNEVALNIPKFQEHFKLSSMNASTGLPYVMAPLLTVEEVLFNKAEALVMLNRPQEAMSELDVFFSRRINSYDAAFHGITVNNFLDFYEYVGSNIDPFFPTSGEQRTLLKGILDVKRKEFVQEGVRWFDVKRFNIEVKRFDTEGNLVDRLMKNDWRRAIQLPRSVIAEGLPANPR